MEIQVFALLLIVDDVMIFLVYAVMSVYKYCCGCVKLQLNLYHFVEYLNLNLKLQFLRQYQGNHSLNVYIRFLCVRIYLWRLLEWRLLERGHIQFMVTSVGSCRSWGFLTFNGFQFWYCYWFQSFPFTYKQIWAVITMKACTSEFAININFLKLISLKLVIQLYADQYKN